VAAPLAALALAGCGGPPYTEVTFRNDLGRPVTIAYCADGDATCRQVRWRVGIDPGARSTQEVRSDGTTVRRFVVVGPPETIYGCFSFRFDGRRPEQLRDLSQARGCGSGR
jgi:hypothetical protein